MFVVLVTKAQDPARNPTNPGPYQQLPPQPPSPRAVVPLTPNAPTTGRKPNRTIHNAEPHFVPQNVHVAPTTYDPKPYNIVGYDPLLRGSNSQNGRFLDPQLKAITLSFSERARCAARRWMAKSPPPWNVWASRRPASCFAFGLGSLICLIFLWVFV